MAMMRNPPRGRQPRTALTLLHLSLLAARSLGRQRIPSFIANPQQR